MTTITAALSTLLVYFVQGAFSALVDETLPNMTFSLRYNQGLKLALLPPAAKFLIAPLVDRAGRAALVTNLRRLQLACCAISVLVALRIDQAFGAGAGTSTTTTTPTAAAAAANWTTFLSISTLFFLAVAIMLSDVVVDTYAFWAAPQHRAMMQIVGIMTGKVFGNPLFVIAEKNFGIPPSFVVWGMAGLTAVLCFALSRPSAEMVVPKEDDDKEKHHHQPLTQQFRQTWDFFVCRPMMFWWALHQIFPPGIYLHLNAVMRPLLVRKFKAFQNTDEPNLGNNLKYSSAKWDAWFFVPCVIAVVIMARLQQGTITGRTFILAYSFQAIVASALVLCLVFITPSKESADTLGIIQGIVMRILDALFFYFELIEFEFYGHVAQLSLPLAAAVIAAQTSVFNVAEYLHPSIINWLAGEDGSGYPFWAAVVIAVGLGYFGVAWMCGAFPGYCDLSHEQWKMTWNADGSPRRLLQNVVLFTAALMITVWMTVTNIAAIFAAGDGGTSGKVVV